MTVHPQRDRAEKRTLIAPTWASERRIYRRTLQKPDGRTMWLYGRAPIPAGLRAPAPLGDSSSASETPSLPNPHLRWHPLRGEWVAYAGHRQNRTFLPPPEYNPLAPSREGAPPTELPAGAYDIAVFQNKFPTLYEGAHSPPDSIVETRPAQGSCEVVVFTQDPSTSLAALPLWNVEMILGVWADRTRELGARSDVHYVFPFENRGVEVGVTLSRPHGQIYAYPFIPPIAARELEQQKSHFALNGTCLLVDHLQAELRDGRRILYEGPEVVAIMPVCARYAYEIWIMPKRPAARLDELTDEEQVDYARALKTVLMKLDALWAKPFPYILAVHQAPTDGAPHPEWQVHIEIYPALRMPNRLKYLAGSEIGAGSFTADTFPEDKVAELQRVEVTLE